MARPASPHDPDAASGTSRAASAAGLGCLILFALPFAATGVGAGGMAAVDVWRWAAVQQWVETPARLLESKLHTHRSSDGATYRVAAKYEYDFGGRPYVSERVAVQTGGDNLGNYHHDAARRLDAVRKAGGATVCYVNPRDPQQAVLFRTLRLGLLCFKLAFALLFGGVGFGLIAAAFFGRRKLRREAELQAAVPLEPWRWRDEWADGRIRSMTGLQAKVAAGFAVAWNLISWPSFIGAAVSRDVGWGALAAIGLFPLVGTGFAIWAGRLWLVRRRWGVSELELTTLPGVLGGPLAGIIRVPCPLAAPRDVELNLACIRSERRTSGGKSTREDVTIWDDDVAVAGRNNEELHGERSLIPVQFAVPYDLPPSGGDVRWTLTARAATAGVDYFAQFEVPVFATDASSPHLTTQAAAKLMADEDPVDFATVARRLAARVEEQTHDRRVLRFPPARNRGLALFISLFAIGWIAACAGLFISDAPRLFPWVFSAFGALIAWMAVVTCARNTQLQYSPRGVAFTHRLLGFGRRHEVPREQIAAIAVARSGVTYKGRAFSRVELTTVAGRRHTLVSDIERRRDAEALAADIETIVGLSESRTGGQASRMPLEQSLPADWRAD